MYIITRYVEWEVLKLFLAALIALTLVVTLGMGVKEGLSRGLPAIVIMRTVPFMLPEILGITLPASMLFSVCSVFGRMTGSNEVVALK
jgi:lipopolysaccharide export system permease protein